MKETGFYWLADRTDATKSHIVAYYEMGSWLFCGSGRIFHEEDLNKDDLVVVGKVEQTKK